MTIYNSILDILGNTPLIRLNKINNTKSNIFLKIESLNPFFSIKDRTALSIINAAEKSGDLKPGGTILEATSGNTGVSLAGIAAARGYKVIICMPEDMSLERRALIKALGGEVILTPAKESMAGANKKAGEIKEKHPDYFLCGQGGNPANPLIHYKSTGEEIWRDTEGKVDIFIASTGTGGTISGAGKLLKEKNPNIRIISVEPSEAPVLSGGIWAPHGIQGITGGNGIPPVTDMQIIDETITISTEEAIKTAKLLIKNEAILCGISTGANVLAALKAAEKYPNTNIATLAPDSAERYISTKLFS